MEQKLLNCSGFLTLYVPQELKTCSVRWSSRRRLRWLVCFRVRSSKLRAKRREKGQEPLAKCSSNSQRKAGVAVDKSQHTKKTQPNVIVFPSIASGFFLIKWLSRHSLCYSTRFYSGRLIQFPRDRHTMNFKWFMQCIFD